MPEDPKTHPSADPSGGPYPFTREFLDSLAEIDEPIPMAEGTGVRWICDTLVLVMRLLGITNREIESKVGWSHGYLSRIFAGKLELRFEHILVISEAAGLTPAEFFHLAYPALPKPLSPAAARVYRLLRRFQPGGP